MKYEQLTPFYAPITAVKVLKAHFLFKKNNKKIVNILKRCNFLMKYDYFSTFVSFRGTVLVSINHGN